MLANLLQSVRVRADEVASNVMQNVVKPKERDFVKMWQPQLNKTSSVDGAQSLLDQWLTELAKPGVAAWHLGTTAAVALGQNPSAWQVPFQSTLTATHLTMEQPAVLTFKEALLRYELVEPFLYSISNMPVAQKRLLLQHRHQQSPEPAIVCLVKAVVPKGFHDDAAKVLDLVLSLPSTRSNIECGSTPLLSALGYLKLIQEDWRVLYLSRLAKAAADHIPGIQENMLSSALPPLPVGEDSLVNIHLADVRLLAEGQTRPPDEYIFYDILIEKQRRRSALAQDCLNSAVWWRMCTDMVATLYKQKQEQHSLICENLKAELGSAQAKVAEAVLKEQQQELQQQQEQQEQQRLRQQQQQQKDAPESGSPSKEADKSERELDVQKQKEVKSHLDDLREQQEAISGKRSEVLKRKEVQLRQLEETEGLLAELEKQSNGLAQLIEADATALRGLTAKVNYVELERKRQTEEISSFRADSANVVSVLDAPVPDSWCMVQLLEDAGSESVRDLQFCATAYKERIQALACFVEYVLSCDGVSVSGSGASSGAGSGAATPVSCRAALARSMRQIDAAMLEYDTLHQIISEASNDPALTSSMATTREALRQLASSCRILAASKTQSSALTSTTSTTMSNAST